MPQSFVQIYVHIVFHTKDNVRLIREDIEKELYSYLGGILKNYKSIPLQIGGTSDHIHILLFRPLRGLISFADVHHRASPDVKIYKAYGLFYNDIFQKKEPDRNSIKHLYLS
jgi:hypothetical protein